MLSCKVRVFCFVVACLNTLCWGTNKNWNCEARCRSLPLGLFTSLLTESSVNHGKCFISHKALWGELKATLNFSVTPSMPHFYCSTLIHWHQPQYLSEQMFLSVWADLAWFWLWQQITTYLVPLNISLIKEEYKLLNNFSDCKSAHLPYIVHFHNELCVDITDDCRRHGCIFADVRKKGTLWAFNVSTYCKTKLSHSNACKKWHIFSIPQMWLMWFIFLVHQELSLILRRA